MMVCYLPTLLFLFFLSIPSFRLTYSIQNNTVFCPEIQKQSLLSFKNSLKDPYKLLSSWDGGVNCCNWNGVTCNNLTGHVHKLTVQGNHSDQFPFGIQAALIGKLNPSLLNLKHLTHLDLSINSFDETIPTFIGWFSQLEYLNLSNSGFHGKIPHNIGNLSSLDTLVLESDENGDYLSQLDTDNLEWLSGLPKLEILNMNHVNLRRATNWAQVINTIPSLIELHLVGCSLDFSAPLNEVNTTSSLTFIHLSYNNFQSSAVLRWILQLSSLVSLDLSDNFLEGPIPTYCNASKLQHINLSGNNFNFSIPDWLYLSKDLEFVDMSSNRLIGTISNGLANLTSLNYFSLENNQLSGKIPKEVANLCKIQMLDLSENNLHGDMLDFFGNMSECFLASLQVLSFRGNQISGNLTDQIGEFKSLESLDLGFNLLSGAIPTNLGKLMSLSSLFLNSNKFIGNLPESLGQLFNLFQLGIHGNMLEGVVTEIHFANLTKLIVFYASSNHHLTLNVSPNWIPPFQLHILKLSSWNFGGVGSEAPSWLENQKNIWDLDLSNTGISFNVPSWFWNIRILNLSHNYLHGKIPYLNGATQLLYMSSNRFSGLLPRVGVRVRELDLSNNSFSGGMSHFLCDMTFETYGLQTLHLGGNQLSGELPDCWLKLPFLRYLNLGNNNLSGSIPHSIGYLRYLQSLNLYNNKFSGQIPFSLHNCTELVKIDLTNNDLHGNIPASIGKNLIHLRYLILRSNKLSGNISSSICCLNYLQILDLSSNNFFGIIPRCVYNFSAMATKRSLVNDYGDRDLDYSFFLGFFIESVAVATKGAMRQYDTILPLITIIDLSKNNLSGDVPKELTSLVELRSLNLSNNHLNGVIPDNIGDMTQLECLDLSVNSLSGQIPNSFKLLSSLAYLNLSFNKLTGEIPESTQISGFDARSFIGNNLCGPQLRRNCSHDDGEHREETEGEKPEIEWLYVLLSLGFAVGFSGVCTTLVLKKAWRDAYFGLLECTWDKAYVHIYIKWRRLTKPSAPNS